MEAQLPRLDHDLPSSRQGVRSSVVGSVPQLDRAGTTGYFLSLPLLESNFEQDVALQVYLASSLPLLGSDKQNADEAAVFEDWKRFGRRCVRELDPLAREMESHKPQLQAFGPFGQRESRLHVCSAWRRMKDIAAEEGLIAIGYDVSSPTRLNHRFHQFVKLLCFGPSSGLYTCPLAMTDGACKLADSFPNHVWLQMMKQHCTSRDPLRFWTSGQWMTERAGGSDVSAGTRTVARELGEESSENGWLLSGYKWFSSAADGEVAITLARIEGDKKLTCFGVATRQDSFDGERIKDSIHIVQLKDKLGTRQLPTAELEITDLEAVKIGERGHGVSAISALLNITRVYNAIVACGYMSRALLSAKRFSLHREAFGRRLSENDLHLHTLLQLEVAYRASLFLTLDEVRLLGEVESRRASKGMEQCCAECFQGFSTHELEALVRLLTPMGKLYTAKQSVHVCSEALECLGGVGYLEPSGMPQLLRDAQVLPVWEGTTNVCCLDILRAMAHPALEASMGKWLHAQTVGSKWAGTLEEAWQQLRQKAGELNLPSEGGGPHALSRELGLSFCRVAAAASLVGAWQRLPPARRGGAELVVDEFLRSDSGLQIGQVVARRLGGEAFQRGLVQEVVYGPDVVRAANAAKL